MSDYDSIISRLVTDKDISDSDLKKLLNGACDDMLSITADKIRRGNYGDEVYIRGLIEFTNYCKNNCYYCGIRRDNKSAVRYRLKKNDILKCCDEGYNLGFRTFVLQGGEDPYYTDLIMCDIISAIREKYPDCAITLSIGEKSKESLVYFYSIDVQMKTVIDRTVAKWREIKNKEFYYIMTDAEWIALWNVSEVLTKAANS